MVVVVVINGIILVLCSTRVFYQNMVLCIFAPACISYIFQLCSTGITVDDTEKSINAKKDARIGKA